MNRLLCALLLATALLGGHARPAQAQGYTGDCSAQDLRGWFSGAEESNDGYLAWISRGSVQAYPTPNGQGEATRLRFNQPVYIIHDRGEMVGIRRGQSAPGSEKLWVRRTDLQCRPVPLRSDGERGLERKVFIRTETTLVRAGDPTSPVAIRAFPDPSLSGCDDPSAIGCRRLGRFELYFVVGETNDAWLLSDRYVLDQISDRLVGWVRKQDGIEWTTSVGLRPSETLMAPGGNEPGTICAYRNAEDARTSRNCQPVLGGRDWFTYPMRMPILGQTGDFYRVAVAATGLATDQIVRAGDGSLRFREAAIQELNHLDVFFLIDGTSSMGPWIDAIVGGTGRPGLVSTIADRLANEFRGGVSLRLGFRVYRDSVAGGQRSGVGEGIALPEGNCAPTLAMAEQSRRRFQEEISRVRTSVDDTDDYPENSFGGIQQAIRDLSGCPGNTKILFVIGDAGYDAASQAQRGFAPIVPERLVRDVNSLQKLMVFFLRPPVLDRSQVRSWEPYVRAYESYRDQALGILGQMPMHTRNGLQPENTFIDVPTGAEAGQRMLNEISGQVRSMARPDIVNELLIDLKGGQSLQAVLARLRREAVDVPIFLYNILESSVCQQLGPQCDNVQFQTVQELLVPRQEAVVLELWMHRRQLEGWPRMLKRIVDVSAPPLEIREAVVRSLVKGLEDMVAQPSMENTGEPLARYMQRAGFLPPDFLTPLMRYSPDELRDATRVPSCELARVRSWIRIASERLDAVENNTLARVELSREPLPCAGISPNGDLIPVVRGGVMRSRPGDTSAHVLCRREREERGETICWVPLEYLP